MAKVIMIQGTMSNAGKSLLLRVYAVYSNRTDTVLRPLNLKIWH